MVGKICIAPGSCWHKIRREMQISMLNQACATCTFSNTRELPYL